MLLGMLNIVTGFVVQDAVEAMNFDRELQSHILEERKGEFLTELKSFFHRMDSQGAGTIKKADFITFMGNGASQDLLRALDINVADAVMLFELLDVDENMEVEIEEFVVGAMHLKTHADLFNMAITLQNNNRLLRKSYLCIDPMYRSVVALGDQVALITQEINRRGGVNPSGSWTEEPRRSERVPMSRLR